jgi:hypothetical protein
MGLTILQDLWGRSDSDHSADAKKTTSQRHSLYYQGFDNLDSYSLQSGIYAGQMCPPCKCKPDLALTKYVLK